MNLNKIFLLGNLASDPEARTTPAGQPVTSFRMATNRMWTDQAGQKQKQAEFHTIVAWGRLAEIAAQYLAKGRLVFVEGRIQTRSWEDKEGNRRYRTEIIAENIQLGPRTDQRAPATDQEGTPASQRPEPRLQTPGASATGGSARPQPQPKEEEIPIIEEETPPADEIKPEDIPF